MHIAIDARIISSSTGRYVERLLHYLQDIDHTNHYSVLVREKDRSYWTPRAENFTVIIADYDNYSFAEQIAFLPFLRSLNADVVHFCMPQQPVLYTGKKVTTIHDLTLLNTYNSDKNFFVYKAKQFVGRFVFRAVIRHSDHIIVPSNYTKEAVISRFPTAARKTTLTYESADIPDVAPQSYEPLISKTFIMYVGSQSDYKNIRRLVEAHQLLLKTHPDLILALVGKLSGANGAAARRTKAWVEENHYQQVLFTDFVTDGQLSWLYSHASAYVFPSLMEGFGLPGLEAMLHGTPVASSNATCLPEILGDAAEYFNPYESPSIAEAVNRILTDSDRRQQLIQLGYQNAKKYSWRTMAEETHAVYMNVLNDATSLPVQ